jgi:hypothetical protein
VSYVVRRKNNSALFIVDGRCGIGRTDYPPLVGFERDCETRPSALTRGTFLRFAHMRIEQPD